MQGIMPREWLKNWKLPWRKNFREGKESLKGRTFTLGFMEHEFSLSCVSMEKKIGHSRQEEPRDRHKDTQAK